MVSEILDNGKKCLSKSNDILLTMIKTLRKAANPHTEEDATRKSLFYGSKNANVKRLNNHENSCK